MNRQRKLVSPSASSPAVAAVMRADKKKDCGPELAVRRLLFGLGYRYRLHARDLPGLPDIVFRNRKKAIFVHGCFWHQHQSSHCSLRSHPKTNTHYWAPKLARNRTRAAENEQKIAEMGWNVLIVWECEIRDLQGLGRRLRLFLPRP
jgi:DNA mismatch endonuclease (patch repair protein)